MTQPRSRCMIQLRIISFSFTNRIVRSCSFYFLGVCFKNYSKGFDTSGQVSFPSISLVYIHISKRYDANEKSKNNGNKYIHNDLLNIKSGNTKCLFDLKDQVLIRRIMYPLLIYKITRKIQS